MLPRYHCLIALMLSQVVKTLLRCGRLTLVTFYPASHYVFDSLQVKALSPTEINHAICSLVDNKAAGLDHITAEHLKFASQRLTVLLSVCFTGFFVHGCLPPDLISVVLVPLIKDKSAKINSKSNYRPIAIASVLSKVLESVILERISEFVTTHDNQFGFKAKLGTDISIYLLKELTDKYKCLNGNVFMCFLDASKAFDRVNHNLLFSKLLKRGVPTYLVRLINFWYTEQTMCVRWAGVISGQFNVTNGVRQGGILSPFLFNLFVDDLSVALNSCNTGCVVGDAVINHVMYADDLVLVSPCQDGLADLIKICESYGLSHDILYNSKKSAVMVFRNHSLFPMTVDFQICGKSIPVVNRVKYLGHWICDSLKDNEDLLRQCRMLYAQCNILKHRFSMCTTPVKIRLFKTYCYSLYCSHLWWNYNQSTYRKVRVAYNDSFRMLLGVPRYCSASQLFVRHNVYTFDALIRNLVFKFTLRLASSVNKLIMCLHLSDLLWCSRIRKFWHSLLFICPS